MSEVLERAASRRLDAYDVYVDSRLPWLGALPAHWEIKRIKYLLREIDDRSTTGTEILLSMRQSLGLVPHNDVSEKRIDARYLVGFKRTHPGDIVVNRMRASIGLIATAPMAGLVSPDYAVFRPIADVNPAYLTLLFKSPALLARFRIESKGLGTGTSGFLRLYSDRFGAIAIPLPPRAEQDMIVAFVRGWERHCARLIRNKRRLIELLDEQKQAIVNRAVTRGVDAGVRLVPSGVDWLGEVPEHWLIKPLKRWAHINPRTLPESTDPDYVFRYVDIGTVGTGFLVEQPERIPFGAAPSRARRILTRGDTIISTVRTYLKAVYFVAEDADDLIASTGFAVLSPGSGVVPEYLGYAIQSAGFIERVTASSVGVAYPAIAESRLGSLQLAIPPTNGEQLGIVEHIKAQTCSIDIAIARARREIDLIREYRTRLIADVVTGQVDVRALAPAVSPNGHEPLDAPPEALLETDAALADAETDFGAEEDGEDAGADGL